MQSSTGTAPVPFPESLTESARRTGNCACMGLDPSAEHLPDIGGGVSGFLVSLLEEMKRRKAVPAAFKPNLGFFHRLDRPLDGDFGGSLALVEILKAIRSLFPSIPVILDAKRGDIAASSANYAAELFDGWEADAITVHPYMGDDSVEPFCRKARDNGGGVYILCRTSNPGAARFQNLETGGGESRPLYMEVSRAIAHWAEQYPGTGAVVGATSPGELDEIVALYGQHPLPLLIPGVGSQGGSAGDVKTILEKHGYPPELVRINSSSGITHPWKRRGEKAPRDWMNECLDALGQLLDATRL